MANAVGNMSPILNNTNPLIDLRERFDEFHHIRSAEWAGFYPTDLHMTPQTITDEYRNSIEQVCPRRKDIKVRGDDGKQVARFSVDYKFKGYGFDIHSH